VTKKNKVLFKSLTLCKRSPNKKCFYSSRVPLSRQQKLLAWHEFPAGKIFTTPHYFSTGTGVGQKKKLLTPHVTILFQELLVSLTAHVI